MYTISTMSQADVETAVCWADQEGWNPGLDDAALFYAADRSGFLLGTLNRNPIASISAVKYGSDFGFIGLYIVQPEFRGQGYGFTLWQHAMNSLKGRNIALDGVVAQQDNYKKSGFKLAHRTIRFAGKSKKTVISSSIQTVQTVGMTKLMQYDQPFFPAPRAEFLQPWVQQAHGHTLAMLEKQTIVGYGTIRACRLGFKIGPLNAENATIALELFNALASSISEHTEIFLDVPEPNAQGVLLAQNAGLSPAFETARMYTGDFPALPLDKIFGITSFELG